MSLRLIQVAPAVHLEASGPSYSVRRLSEALIVEGHFLTLATLNWPSSPPQISFLKTFPFGMGPQILGRSPLMNRWLSKMVEFEQVDIIHNHGMWQMNAVYPGWAVKKGNAKLVISPRGAFSQWAMQHGSKLKKLFWPLLQLPAFKMASCFHATGVAEYEDIRRMGFNQPIAIIPNGVDIPDLSPELNRSYRTLLFISRIHPIKGIDNLLHAWRAVQHRFPDWRLDIAGPDNGDYPNKMKTLSRQLGAQRVSFPGPLYGKEKLAAYAQADLYVLPTHSENFGMTVAEALAAGTPAIVTKGAPWEGLEREGAGRWIDIGVEPLAAALEQTLILPRDQLIKMGQQGRRWMEAEFTWREIGKNMAETYKWLIDSSREKPECVWIDK